jgi:hypothetical protein
MVKRQVLIAVILGLVAGVPSRADDAEKKTPAVVVRVKSLDGLIDDAKYVAQLAGRGEDAKQAEGFLRAFLGEKGSEAIDPTRPIGFYAVISNDFLKSNGALMLPVGSEKSLIGLLERFAGQAKKGDDDIYTVTHPNVPVPVPVFMKFENKYAYITAQNRDALLKENLLEPKDVFGAEPPKTVSIFMSFDRVPGDVKDFVLGFVDARFAEEQSKTEPGQTKAVQALRVEVLRELARQTASLINQSGKLDLFFDVDQKNQELVAELNLTPRKGSKLAAQFGEFSKTKSAVAGIPAGDPAASMVAHILMPDKIRQALEPVIDEAMAKAMENMSDATKREQAEKLFKAVAPTLKAGELDASVVLHGPTGDNLYTVVAGLKVKDGRQIESAFKELVRSIPERDQRPFKFDVEKVEGAGTHRFELQPLYSEHIRSLVGENPVHVAARSDTIIVAVGPDGQKALKQALAAQPATSPVLGTEAALARLVPAMGHMFQAHRSSPEALRKAAAESFANGEKGADLVRFTVTGGDTFKARYSVKASAFKFTSKIGGSYRASAPAPDE